MISKAMLLSCLVASNSHLYVNNELNKFSSVGRSLSVIVITAVFLEERLDNHLFLSFGRTSYLYCSAGESYSPSSPMSYSLQHSLHHTPTTFLKCLMDCISLDQLYCTHLAGLKLQLVHHKDLKHIFCLWSISSLVSGACSEGRLWAV